MEKEDTALLDDEPPRQRCLSNSAIPWQFSYCIWWIFYWYFIHILMSLKWSKTRWFHFSKDIQNICDVRDEREVHNENFKVIKNNVVATMNKVNFFNLIIWKEDLGRINVCNSYLLKWRRSLNDLKRTKAT